jgi:tetratricopeptide (TPR) repeat protein
MQILVGHTDPQGAYTFSALHEGVYALRAAKAGYLTATISSLFLGPKEVKAVDLTLAPANPASPPGLSQTPQFFDPPKFTVSGVTDTTNLGGHGSNTVLRTRDSLAKETASLGAADAGADAGASAGPGARSEPASGPAGRSPLEGAERERDRAQAQLLQHPDDPKLHHGLADADEKLGDPLAALHEYQRAAELDPSEPNFFDWGAELLLHHAPEPAGEVFGNGNRRFPKSSRMLIGLGAAWFARGAVDAAVEKICQASDLDPSDPRPYIFLGKIESAETTPPAKVLETLQRFVRLHPTNAEANYYYGMALWKLQKRPEGAARVESLLNRAVELDPKFGAAYLQLGVLHSEQGNYRKAIVDYQRAIEVEVEKDHADSEVEIEDAHYRLAQAYREIGDRAKGQSELQFYEEMAKKSDRESDRERHEIRQFVYTLRDQPAAPNQ